MKQRLPSVLQPRTYVSPSGEYTALVNPTNREGGGPAHYRVKRGQTVLWEGKRPFTLWEADLTDSGTLAGYAYSQGEEGFWGLRQSRGYGTLDVVILTPDGTTRLRTSVPRESGYLHGLPSPWGEGVLASETTDRLFILTGNARQQREERWFVYALSTGKRLKDLVFNEEHVSILKAKSVAGTPLFLLHQWLFTDGDPWHTGARFTLIDLNGKSVWKQALPTDYDIPHDEDAQDSLRNEIRRDGAILETTKPGEFTLRFVREKQRVTFTVAKEPDGAWRVMEAGREPYVVPKPPPLVFTAPTVALTHQGTLTLRSPSTQAAHPIREIRNLIAAGPGRLAFLREDKDLVVVSEQGKLLSTISLAPIALEREKDRFSQLLWRNSEQFLVFVEREKEGKRFLHTYPVDARTKTVGKPLRSEETLLQAAAALPRGGFITLGSIHQRYTISHALVAYDGALKKRWELIVDGYRDSEKPRALLSPESATVLRDGTVAVLDVTQKTVHLYTEAGHWFKTISLQKAWKREPRYPNDIRATPDGGFLIHDFNSEPSLIWMTKTGRVLAEATPHDLAGQAIEFPQPTITTSGNLWVSDDYCLLQQNQKGRPVRLLGTPPDTRSLTAISDLTIHPDGRILAVDKRTSTAHLFAADGTWRTRYRPMKPQSSFRSFLGTALTFGPSDTFRIEDEWFDLRGKPIPRPKLPYRRPLERRPDGRWLDRIRLRLAPGAVARDGSLALLDDKQVCLYTPAREPLRQFPLPDNLGDYPELAYDGKHVVVAGDKALVCYTATGEPRWQAPLPFPEALPFLTDEGQTLCLFDGKRTIYRYAMLQ
ncbi:hypothetical protein [Armatimonas rosea]|uniref:Uncharacterized protein n=1 Tax=Armatimonas rosea TaxID=685828 RepID=A0A7W9SP99_ARMRO|nr:hypothetical protein [Armatimonas rosea]MBB6050271.1 hypothetical protein [Armatimonas rosea]